MRNLKRALSLALAAVMVLGMMVVGAGAAYKDFTDVDEIKHEEAVKTLVTLNVIAGKEDGSYYDPAGSLTRAEMAKLVVYVLHGGTEPVLGTKATPTYSDIKGTWAEAYIEYCSSVGIIAGDGAGKFNPEGTLTGSQAAKMLLVAMNYDAKVFKFTGSNWEINVNREASAAGLYDQLSGMNPAAVISRDDAAQMVYNAILAKTMKLTWGQNMNTGEISQNYSLTGASLFADKFGGTAYEGVLVATGKYGLDKNPLDVAETFSASRDKISIAATKIDQNDLPYSYTPASGAPVSHPKGEANTFKYTEDLSNLMGQSVKVLYNNSKKEVYGVYPVAANNETVIETTTDNVDKIKTSSIEVDGTVYDTDSLLVYVDGVTKTTAALSSSAARPVTFIDNDNDGKLELAIVNTIGSYKVTYKGSSTFTTSFVAGDTNITSASQKLEDVTAYEDMAKDDIVFVTKDLFAGKDMLSKGELAEGTISGKQALTGGGYKYQIDGEWYKATSGYSLATINNGDTVKYLASGGLFYYAKVTSGAGSVADVAMLVSVDGSSAVSKAQAVLLFSDGTKKTVSTKFDYDAVTRITATVDSDKRAATFTDNVADLTNCGKLYKYTVDNNGVYTLTEALKSTGAGVYEKMGDYSWVNVNETGTTDATGKALSITAAGATIDGVPVADDAVIYLFNQTLKNGTSGDSADAKPGNKTNDAKIMTGKDLKNMATGSTATTLSSVVFSYATSVNNGLTRVAFAAVSTGAYQSDLSKVTSTSSANYGYLVSAPYTTKVDGTNYVVYPIWNGSEMVEYRDKNDNIVTGTANGVTYDNSTTAKTVGKGLVIGYDVVDSTTIKNVTLIDTTVDAVTGGAGGKELQFKKSGTAIKKLTGDTVYLYVDSKADKTGDIGVTGGSVQNATKPTYGSTSVYIQNAMYKANAAGEIEIIVVDVENQLAQRDKTAMTAYTSKTGVSVTVNDVELDTTAGNNFIAAGDVIKITTDESTTCSYSIDNIIEGDKTSIDLAANSSVTFTADGTAMTITLAAHS